MISLTTIKGFQVGHWSDVVGRTGCTVVLCPSGTIGAVSVRGSAPGSRETDALRVGNLAPTPHAVVLAGGSAFGLEAATGVMRYCREQGRGVHFGGRVVPIVPAAVLFDLNRGSPVAFPDAEAGYAACLAANGAPVIEGRVGAGCGAGIGHSGGANKAAPGGVGSAGRRVGSGWTVAALAAVNCLGAVVNPSDGRMVSGPRDEHGAPIDVCDALIRMTHEPPRPGVATTLVVLATDAPVSHVQLRGLAEAAHDGLALAIRPAHTRFDGDTVFALSNGLSVREQPGDLQPDDLLALAVAATQASSDAIVRAAQAAAREE